MKKQFTILGLIVFAITHMNFTELKVIGTGLGIISAGEIKAQFQQAVGVDSACVYNGQWYPSNLIWSSKDSIGVTNTSYFKINTNKIQLTRFPSTRNDGAPNSMVWVDGNGFIKVSPYSAGSFTVNSPVAAPSHSVVNTSYQPSLVKDTEVNISTSISCTLSLSGGQSGDIQLQYSPNGTTWTTYSRSKNANTGALTIGLNTTQISGCQLRMTLPKGWYWRWTTSGTGTFSITDIFETPIN